MGAKTWMLVYANGSAKDALASKPVLDRQATEAWTAQLFPKEKLTLMDDVDLSYTCPPEKDIFAGCFGDVSVIAAWDFAIDYPSKLAARFVEAGKGGRIYLHAMHSVSDWAAFAIWEKGRLLRSVSLSPDFGVMENLGEPLAFEGPYWRGELPANDPDDIEAGETPYPLPFHPLDFGETVLRECFGYYLEGDIDPSLVDPQTVPLMRFKRRKSLLRFFG